MFIAETLDKVVSSQIVDGVPKPTILLVEDEESVGSVFTSMVQRDYDVQWFQDGTSAMEYLQDNSVDLLFADFRLPDVSGVEIIEAFKKMHPGVPAILASGYTSKEVGESLADLVVSKPFSSVKELRAQIASQLEKSNYILPKIEHRISLDQLPELDSRRIARYIEVGLRAKEALHDIKNKSASIVGLTDIIYEAEGIQDHEELIGGVRRLSSICQSLNSATINDSVVGYNVDLIYSALTSQFGAIESQFLAFKEEFGMKYASKIDAIERNLQAVKPHLVELRDSYVQPSFEDVNLVNFFLEFAGRINQDHVGLNASIRYGGSVKVDSTRFSRIFNTLYDNSLEAFNGGKDPIVSISTSAIFRGGRHYVKIDYKDNGSGFPEEIISRLGEKHVTCGKKNGTGLGLAIVKDFALQHGGTFRAYTDGGANIEIMLPINPTIH
ncbi:response regulator [Candidatus Woesearchaeota archaeon]|nr:response regulator [Candidatus Woesearchaeota archaeon]